MFDLRIRQAELALLDGRLEEAYELAQKSDVREHRRGQELIGRLTERLVERGKAHRDVGQYEQSLKDCDKATKLAGNRPDIAELRSQALAGVLSGQNQQRHHDDLLRQAKQQINQGQLTLAAGMLNDLDQSSDQAQALKNRITQQKAEVETNLVEAEQALEQNQYTRAMDALLQIKQVQPKNSNAVALLNQLTATITKDISQAFEQGRVDRAGLLLKRYEPLLAHCMTMTEAARAVQLCYQANQAIEQSQWASALKSLRSVKQMMAKVVWVESIITQLEQTMKLTDEIKTGPLGLLEADLAFNDLGKHANQPDAHWAKLKTKRLMPPLPPSPSSSSSSPSPRLNSVSTGRFVLQIDGAGSYLVTTASLVTLGPISSSCPVDIALMAAANTPRAMIERIDEDYFIKSDGRCGINGKSYKEKMLVSSDRITLGPRSSMKFRMPTGASGTAVLELGGAKLARPDIRHIILLDQTLVIGSGPAAHIRVSGLDEPLVLQYRDGQWVYRDGQTQSVKNISISQPFNVQEVSFVFETL